MDTNEPIIPREQVAKHLAVPTRLLLRYEARGLIHAVRADGAEGYEPRELRRVWSVVSLHRDAGINLAGVEAILRLKERMEALHERIGRLAVTLEALTDSAGTDDDESGD
jgi:MerR family transcriptional regulator/heat shock protein HspR